MDVDNSWTWRGQHLLVYSDGTEFAGAETALGNLIGALDAGIRVTVTGPDPDVVQRLAEQRPGCGKELLRPAARLRDSLRIAEHVRFLRSVQPSILHVNMSSPWSGRAMLGAAALIRDLPVVAVEQLPMPFPARRRFVNPGRWHLPLLRRVSAHVAVGEHAARLVERYENLPPGSVATVHNGVPDVRLGQVARPDSGPLFGVNARLVPQKGLDVLIRALTDVPEARVRVFGEGPERASLQALAESLGVSERFDLAGWHPAAREELTRFTAFVLPSRYEGFPLSIVEAMLAELPVVASDVGSVSEAVKDQATGYLVPPDDPGALAGALRLILADAEHARRMGILGRQHAFENFSDVAMARKFEAIYRQLLAGRGVQ